MTLEVRRAMHCSKIVFKYGFEIKVRKQYYSDNKEDAIIMWRDNL